MGMIANKWDYFLSTENVHISVKTMTDIQLNILKFIKITC